MIRIISKVLFNQDRFFKDGYLVKKTKTHTIFFLVRYKSIRILSFSIYPKTKCTKLLHFNGSSFLIKCTPINIYIIYHFSKMILVAYILISIIYFGILPKSTYK